MDEWGLTTVSDQGYWSRVLDTPGLTDGSQSYCSCCCVSQQLIGPSITLVPDPSPRCYTSYSINDIGLRTRRHYGD